MTAGELAERASLSENYIRVLESGVRTGGSVAATKRIADALGVTVDNLIDDGEIEEILERIELLRKSRVPYSSEEIAAEIENIQIFTSMMREADRLHLSEEAKQLLREDIEDAKRASRREPPAS